MTGVAQGLVRGMTGVAQGLVRGMTVSCKENELHAVWVTIEWSLTLGAEGLLPLILLA